MRSNPSDAVLAVTFRPWIPAFAALTSNDRYARPAHYSAATAASVRSTTTGVAFSTALPVNRQ